MHTGCSERPLETRLSGCLSLGTSPGPPCMLGPPLRSTPCRVCSRGTDCPARPSTGRVSVTAAGGGRRTRSAWGPCAHGNQHRGAGWGAAWGSPRRRTCRVEGFGVGVGFASSAPTAAASGPQLLLGSGADEAPVRGGTLGCLAPAGAAAAFRAPVHVRWVWVLFHSHMSRSGRHW